MGKGSDALKPRITEGLRGNHNQRKDLQSPLKPRVTEGTVRRWKFFRPASTGAAEKRFSPIAPLHRFLEYVPSFEKFGGNDVLAFLSFRQPTDHPAELF